MSFWRKYKQESIFNRIVEEEIYEQVVKELNNGVRRDGLWGKALQKSDGNENKAKSLYIKYRVQSIQDEIVINEDISNLNSPYTSRGKTVNAIDAFDMNGLTLLMKAVKAMDVGGVEKLIHEGANPRIAGHFGTTTALMIAQLQLKRAMNPDDEKALQEIVSILLPITN